MFIDPDLLQRSKVWEEAVMRNGVFGIEPHTLVEAIGEVLAGMLLGRSLGALVTPIR